MKVSITLVCLFVVTTSGFITLRKKFLFAKKHLGIPSDLLDQEITLPRFPDNFNPFNPFIVGQTKEESPVVEEIPADTDSVPDEQTLLTVLPPFPSSPRVILPLGKKSNTASVEDEVEVRVETPEVSLNDVDPQVDITIDIPEEEEVLIAEGTNNVEEVSAPAAPEKSEIIAVPSEFEGNDMDDINEDISLNDADPQVDIVIDTPEEEDVLIAEGTNNVEEVSAPVAPENSEIIAAPSEFEGDDINEDISLNDADPQVDIVTDTPEEEDVMIAEGTSNVEEVSVPTATENSEIIAAPSEFEGDDINEDISDLDIEVNNGLDGSTISTDTLDGDESVGTETEIQTVPGMNSEISSEVNENMDKIDDQDVSENEAVVVEDVAEDRLDEEVEEVSDVDKVKADGEKPGLITGFISKIFS